MKRQSSKGVTKEKSPLLFLFLVFVFSIPLSLAGTLIGLEILPGVPVSSLVVTFCPLMAACILVYRENKVTGVIGLLKRAFDYKRIRAKIWYAPILLLMPGVMVLSYGLMRLMGSPIPVPQFPLWTPPVMFVPFFFAALSEELGWMGYAIDPIQARTSALRAAVLLGLAWAAWHIIPVVRAQRSLEWIAWQCLFWVASRVLFVWLYNNTGKSVFAATVYHAMPNLTWQLFPINGSYYDPRITALIVAFAAVIVTVLWGPETLAQYRHNRSSGQVQSTIVN